MKKTIFGLILLAMISCNNKVETTFSLNGKTNNLKNGTVLYLENNLSNTVIDSTTVKENEFQFSTNIKNFPARIHLRTRDYSQRRDIWLENNRMTFDATKTDFVDAKVTGSQSEILSQKLYAKADKISFEERNKLEKDFVKENPNSIVSAFILSVFSRDWGNDFTKEYYERFSDDVKNSEYGERISNYIVLNRDIKIGDKYSDFEMDDQYGNQKKLSELLGEVTLLEFWASWCGPCRKENPSLVRTYEKYNPKGFEIVAVSLDKEKTKWLDAIQKDGLNWPNFCDFEVWENDATLMYGVYEIPDNFLIDKNGEIVARYIRGEELNEKLSELTK